MSEPGRIPDRPPRVFIQNRPATGDMLEELARRLKLPNSTEALQHAIAIALRITEGGRMNFFLEERDGTVIEVVVAKEQRHERRS